MLMMHHVLIEPQGDTVVLCKTILNVFYRKLQIAQFLHYLRLFKIDI